MFVYTRQYIDFERPRLSWRERWKSPDNGDNGVTVTSAVCLRD